MAKRRTFLLVAGVSLLANVAGVGFMFKAVADRGGLDYVQRRLGFGEAQRVVPARDRVETLRLIPNVDNEVVFLGDSLTEAFRWSERFPGRMVQNHGIGGNRVADVSDRLDDVLVREPAAIALNIGTNDIGDLRPPADIAADIEVLLDRIASGSPGTRVVLKTVPPRRGALYAEPIAALNTRLAYVADDRDLELVDLYSSMVGQDGEIIPRFTTDGVHLSAAAYAAWSDAVASSLGFDGVHASAWDGDRRWPLNLMARP